MISLNNCTNAHKLDRDILERLVRRVVSKYDKLVIATSIFIIVILLVQLTWHFTGRVLARARISAIRSVINDTHLTAELVASCLKFPSAMAFLGPNDILVTEKNSGNVQRLVDVNIAQQHLINL